MVIDINKTVNCGSLEHLTRMMYLSVKTLYENDLYTPILCLICASIHGLGDGEKGTFIKNLETYFPELYKHINAYDFYDKIRNGSAHYFRMKSGIIIAKNYELNSLYVKNDITTDNLSVVTINIDRFIEDFVNWVLKIRKENNYLEKSSCKVKGLKLNNLKKRSVFYNK